MASKNRPRAAHEALSRQAASTRSGAPGRHFIGDTAGQQAAARRQKLERVAHLVEEDRERREREAALARPLRELVEDLVRDVFRLTRTLASAPFRIAAAFRRPSERTG